MPMPKARKQKITDIADEFWGRVIRPSDDPDQCWPWSGKPAVTGYGQLQRRGISPQPLSTHRVAWELIYGPIPEGKHVLHRCDNRICCRPDHLFLGDQVVNNIDRQAKGRTACGDRNGARTKREANPFVRDGGSGLRGENHPQSVLSDADRALIVLRWRQGNVMKVELSRQFGVSPTQIGRIIKQHTSEDHDHVRDQGT